MGRRIGYWADLKMNGQISKNVQKTVLQPARTTEGKAFCQQFKVLKMYDTQENDYSSQLKSTRDLKVDHQRDTGNEIDIAKMNSSVCHENTHISPPSQIDQKKARLLTV